MVGATIDSGSVPGRRRHAKLHLVEAGWRLASLRCSAYAGSGSRKPRSPVVLIGSPLTGLRHSRRWMTGDRLSGRRSLNGRNGTATEPFSAMLSRCPRSSGHVGKLKRCARAADCTRRAYFRGLNDPFGVQLNPCFGRDCGRGCRKGSIVGTLPTRSDLSPPHSMRPRSALRKALFERPTSGCGVDGVPLTSLQTSRLTPARWRSQRAVASGRLPFGRDTPFSTLADSCH